MLKEPKSVLLLHRQLRKCGGRESKEANWIRALGSQSWQVDAQILADLVSLIPGLTDISLNVGPTFAPEHLDDIFKAPRPDLLSLELVFTPYVDTPTYYQFLKVASHLISVAKLTSCAGVLLRFVADAYICLAVKLQARKTLYYPNSSTYAASIPFIRPTNSFLLLRTFIDPLFGLIITQSYAVLPTDSISPYCIISGQIHTRT
jgi:hypothetical protein